jgi:hypothetical protein
MHELTRQIGLAARQCKHAALAALEQVGEEISPDHTARAGY